MKRVIRLNIQTISNLNKGVGTIVDRPRDESLAPQPGAGMGALAKIVNNNNNVVAGGCGANVSGNEACNTAANTCWNTCNNTCAESCAGATCNFCNNNYNTETCFTRNPNNCTALCDNPVTNFDQCHISVGEDICPDFTQDDQLLCEKNKSWVPADGCGNVGETDATNCKSDPCIGGKTFGCLTIQDTCHSQKAPILCGGGAD